MRAGGEIRKVFTVDAAGRTLGRVASEAASVLLGKKSVTFTKNAVLPVEVKIINAKQLKITEKRLREKSYRYYTGAIDGLRELSLPQMLEKKGVAHVLRMAVDGMLPRNTLRTERMKRLTITD